MKAASILVCLALLTLQSAAQDAVTFPKILEGGGHTCYGHLWRTDKTLYWKAVFTSCRSPYTVVSQEGSTGSSRLRRARRAPLS